VIPGRSDVTINVMDPAPTLTSEQRAAAMENLEDAPGFLKPLFVTLLDDPAGFRSRVINAIPKMVFALVPVFALILAAFYRRRRFMQHLIFALHLHAAIFLVLAASQIFKFTRVAPLAAAAALAALAFLSWYVIRGQRVVYGEGRGKTMLKSVGILLLYFVVFVPGILAVVAWAAYFR
jgi:hypothetical protein